MIVGHAEERELRIAERAPIRHIDNPAIHAGFSTAETLLNKYHESVENFRRLCQQTLGRTPAQHTTALRLQYAALLLTTTGLVNPARLLSPPPPLMYLSVAPLRI